MRDPLPNPFMPGPIDQDSFIAALPAELVPRDVAAVAPKENEPMAASAKEDDIDQSFLDLLADLAEAQAEQSD